MNKINENGRSMIEMLGVLAIIGVLSVGGIMGYSKAMFRYKINKTIEQITYIAGNIRTTFANQGNYAGLTSDYPEGRKVLQKAHIIPENMWKDYDEEMYDDDDIRPQHLFGGSVYIDTDCDDKCFRITYMNLPEEACIELVSHNWINTQVKSIDVETNRSYCFIPPANPDQAVKLCSSDTGTVLEVNFYFGISDFLINCIDDTAAWLSVS